MDGKIMMPIYQGVDGSRHVVAADWRVWGDLPDGRRFSITVRRGFEFDGASIPRFLWRLCGHPMEVPRIAAALAHDWLYASHACDRATADLVFREICRAVGVGRFRRFVEYRVLRLCGDAAWRGHGPKDQETAWHRGNISINNKDNKEE